MNYNRKQLQKNIEKYEKVYNKLNKKMYDIKSKLMGLELDLKMLNDYYHKNRKNVFHFIDNQSNESSVDIHFYDFDDLFHNKYFNKSCFSNGKFVSYGHSNEIHFIKNDTGENFILGYVDHKCGLIEYNK